MVNPAPTLPRIAWDSVLDGAALSSASSTEVDGSVDQAADWVVWTFWRPTGAGPHVIEADLGSSKTVNSWALAGHNASGLIGMDTWNGSSWVVFKEATADGTGVPLYLIGDAAVSTTKLRFRFANISFLSTLWAGQDMILPEGLTPGWTDPVMAQRADITPEVSRDGIWLGAAIERWNATLVLSIKNVEATWSRDYWTPFVRRCSIQPFFLHWNSTDWPASACLCTKAKFGDSSFSGNGFVNLNVTFDADTGLLRTIEPLAEGDPLLIEDPEGPLLLE